jgi:excisionase family DNA binding protein
LGRGERKRHKTMSNCPSEANQPRPDFLTVKEVAAIVRAKPATVYGWIGMGALPCICLGPKGRTKRIARADLDQWITSCRRTTEGLMFPPAGRRPRKGG